LLDFIDAYHAALIENQQSELFSYDTDFDQVSGLKRIEP